MALAPHSHITGISAFVHSVEAGSFTAAAARMGLTKSAVGKNVTRLEERLGVRLLNRTTRRISLTVEGQTYYTSCLRVLEELGTAEALLASRRQEVSGRLRINIPISFGRLWVMPILQQVANAHPKLDLDVTFADRLVDLVDEGIDLVVRIGLPGDQASLQGRAIGTQRWILCASPSYLAERGRPETVDDLAKHDCIVFARDGKARPWVLPTSDGSLIDVRIKPKHVICHGEALRDAVLAGMGLAYLTTWLIADDLRGGRLERVIGVNAIEGEPIHVLWPSSRSPTPKTRAVIDALVAAFLPVHPWD